VQRVKAARAAALSRRSATWARAEGARTTGEDGRVRARGVRAQGVRARWRRSSATIAEEEDDGCVKHLGGRRSGHGADVDDEPNLCKVMAWGVIVSTSHARGGDRVCVHQVGSMACVGACVCGASVRVCVREFG